jgi:ornithine carbamoyltransferase
MTPLVDKHPYSDRSIPSNTWHMKLICINDLTPQDIQAIWQLAAQPIRPLQGNVAWSFEGNGIRTRTTFIQAFRELNLSFVELPNLLKTAERAGDLAGYLDPFYDVYVIRDGNHDRLIEFAQASHRPVVNAMTSLGHPCEVLTDAYSIEKNIGPLANTQITLWGPTTNVFRSWHELAQVLGFDMVHVCDAQFHERKEHVRFVEKIDRATDVLITDSWPSNFENTQWSLTLEHLAALGHPKLLATPPFHIGQEVAFDPLHYKGWMGYLQKMDLLPVQKAILSHLMTPSI